MKFALYFLFSLSFLLGTAITTEAQRGIPDGDYDEDIIDVDPFTAIDVESGWDLILIQGSGHQLRVVADKKSAEQLVTEVRDKVLYISSKNSMTRINWKSKRKIYVTFEDLNSLQASQGSDVEAKGRIKADKFALRLSNGSDLEDFTLSANQFVGQMSGGSDAEIEFESINEVAIQANGGSDASIKGLAGKSCSIEAGGGSDLNLEGNVGTLMIKATGGSDVNANRLEVEEGILTLTGSSDGDFKITGTVDITLRGGSDVNCRGGAQIVKKDVCKSCDFSMR